MPDPTRRLTGAQHPRVGSHPGAAGRVGRPARSRQRPVARLGLNGLINVPRPETRRTQAAAHDVIEGQEHLGKIVTIDQNYP
ncbi:MAG: hypothetical protein SWK90_14880 [Chloroflexota bacterium]|nr:hypothetical protein [Chloroflexota bacterium]